MNPSPPVDHFSHQVARPFLTGTVAHSLIIDITKVFDRQKEFIVALTLYCDANTHLWAVSEHMRRDNNRVYAEISVSPSMYQQILVNPALQLENFDEPLMAYPTLLPSANIVKLSLSRLLPPQYGRQDGGNQQLRADMHHNLDRFGQLIDCGYVTGGGYAVLAVDANKHETLLHSFNWAYHPIDCSSGELLTEQDHILSLATWAAMPPYCKYCHSMGHSLIQCATRKQKITCDLCGVAGHFKRSCPRRNEDADNSTKKRKVFSEQQQKQMNSNFSSTITTKAKSKSTATAKNTAADAKAADDANPQPVVNASTAVPAQNAGAPLLATGNNNTSLTNPHRTRSTTVNSPCVAPATPVIQPCKTCNGTDHKMKSSLRCLRNPKGPNFISDAEWTQLNDQMTIAPKETDAIDTDKMDTGIHDDDGSASMQN
ncbi:hypothetical protein PS15p_200569 [Mucor circinelloides]